MSMSEKIEPALTAEEWILRRYERPDFAMELGADGPFPYRLDIEGNDSTDESPNSASVDLSEHGAATAAFALYNQPFGFTREDVAAIRIVHVSRPEIQSRLESLADRIEALLPDE